jgi:hypothetical protein
MWTSSHMTHAANPDRWTPFTSATAFERPMVARFPLST